MSNVIVPRQYSVSGDSEQNIGVMTEFLGGLANQSSISGGFPVPLYDEADFANFNTATPPVAGLITLKKGGTTVAVITITFDGSNNITKIQRTS